MTTIPDTAVTAAVDAAYRCRDASHGQGFARPQGCCVRLALAAALPLLGDTTTEWGLRVSQGNVEGVNVQPDEAAARELLTAVSDADSNDYQWDVVSRTVITGEWTQV